MTRRPLRATMPSFVLWRVKGAVNGGSSRRCRSETLPGVGISRWDQSAQLGNRINVRILGREHGIWVTLPTG
jgi:hypothetical protein